MPRLRVTRRGALAGCAALLAPRGAAAFGQATAFHPRLLLTGPARSFGPRASAPGHWSSELMRRTNAPARVVVRSVAADEPALLEEPFAIWAGGEPVADLTAPEVRGLRAFVRLGGMLIVDDWDPERGAFRASARRELVRVLPELPLIKLDAGHVIYKTFYLVDRPAGRVLGPPHLDVIIRGKNAQVVFLSHDLLGALARSPTSGWAFPTTPGGERQREVAIRLAVNLAMYVLCSDYKDDQVHAPFLMRRRARARP